MQKFNIIEEYIDIICIKSLKNKSRNINKINID